MELTALHCGLDFATSVRSALTDERLSSLLAYLEEASHPERRTKRLAEELVFVQRSQRKVALRKSWLWMVDEHLESSGVGAGKRSMMRVKDLPGELEATVAREKQHVRWSLRHQPASSCLAVYYGRRQDVRDVRMGGSNEKL